VRAEADAIDGMMDTRENNSKRLDIATRILAGLVANPSIIAPRENCGWSLCNITENQIAIYAVVLAEALMVENEEFERREANC